MADSGLIDVDGGRLYYEVEGDGHPLLLIHGGLGDLRMWDDQVPVVRRALSGDPLRHAGHRANRDR